MSINYKQSIKCPGCDQMSDMTLWSSITVKDSADLKNDLLQGKINIFRCPSCQTVGLMPNPLLYHDEEKKLIISYAPCGNQEMRLNQFEEVKKVSKESGELKNFDGYNLRFCTNMNELLEKILLFDYHLNDKAVEIIKLMILMQEPDQAQDRECRFGKIENGVMEFVVRDFKEQNIYTSKVPEETYYKLWESARKSGVKPYSFDWEMVDKDYAAAIMSGMN